MRSKNNGKKNRIYTFENTYQKTLKTITITTISLSSLFSACDNFFSKDKTIKQTIENNNLNDSIKKKALQDSANIYENLGLKKAQEDNISESIKYYLQALHYHKLLNNKKQEQIITKNIGMLYFQQKNYEKYLIYINRALELAKEINYEYGIRYTNLLLGEYMYEIKKETDSALIQHFLPGWEAIKNITNPNQKQKLIIYYACDIASCYMDKRNYQEAQNFRNEAEKGNIQLKDTNITITINQNKGILAKYNNNYQDAEKYLHIALQLSQQTNNKFKTTQTLGLLSTIYEEQNKPHQALKYYKESMQIEKEIINQEAAKTQQETETKLKTAEKEYEIIKQQAKIEKQEENRKKMIWGYIAALAVILGFAGTTITYRTQRNKIARKNEEIETLNKHLEEEKAMVEEANNMLEEKHAEVEAINHQLEEKNKIIESKNKNITDSIRYASYIQKNILPSDKEVKKLFPESFIFYQPKDIVSGDFYWVKETINGKKLFAAVDCTGHGVPGAFLSLIGNNILNNAIKQGLENPGEILDYLNNNITKSIIKDETIDKNNIQEILSGKDSMDIALCCYDEKTQILEYAGIHNPIYIVHKNEFIQLNAEKMPIGIGGEKGYGSNETKTKKIDPGSIIYLFSDGYADQFGEDEYGKKGKMMRRRFRALVEKASKYPIDQQKEIFEKYFHERKGKYQDQIDDVLVMGIKI